MEVSYLICFVVILGLLFDYTNGFHDAANVVSTTIATAALRPKWAFALAAFCNTIGAFCGAAVAKTIATGIISSACLDVWVVIAAISGAIAWNVISWCFRVPSSSSYALVGGLIGAGFFAIGLEGILWTSFIFKIVLPMIISPLVGFGIAYGVMHLFSHYHPNPSKAAEERFRKVQVGSACLIAVSHGLNDAQKSMGVITLGLFSVGAIAAPMVPSWVVLACALTIGIGTATGGMRIVKTVSGITKLSPIQGCAADFSSSIVILVASFLGVPLSTTQMIVGSITGVGTAKGFRHVSWVLSKKIVYAWVVTIPSAAVVSGTIYKIIKIFAL